MRPSGRAAVPGASRPACQPIPPEISDDDRMMEMGSDDDSGLDPTLVHVVLAMEQVQAHFNATMVE